MMYFSRIGRHARVVSLIVVLMVTSHVGVADVLAHGDEQHEKKALGGAGKREGLSQSPFRNKRDHEIKWYAWGDEPFDRAQAEDKLILLDLTAVWCHWCHVMDETSYSDPEIIEMLNRDFIAMRIDTDRRPDLQARVPEWRLAVDRYSCAQWRVGVWSNVSPSRAVEIRASRISTALQGP